ncbi:MAG: UvrABC system protein A [candidate division TA06 bacterium ADurb.Bin417]|uniref:UvrABC system protein A n=1 Tax=candidate division TA06 bacterium ADurb.Bin417 TaxID=1852828 RepID=A0A1V5MJC3_UNCT6|nr:MAG: UvrABC system protein A [candidate division TA06 bacterium ADurb.Bin417]
MEEKIIVRGAREHNLQNIDLELPRNRLIVVTGISGSGKSSLAFDTLYAEGQRRYIESLSAYARQFLEQMQKPDVDHIWGLPPAIAIEQRRAGGNPRSTVATITEIYDYLRLLFSRVGTPHCPKCGRVISRQTVQDITDRILELPAATSVSILAPMVRGRKGEYREIFAQVARAGFLKVRVDGRFHEVSEEIKLSRYRNHTIEVLVDTLEVSPAEKARVTESVETGLKLGQGLLTVLVGSETLLFSERYACSACGFNFEELTPRMFSFNSPYGACPECKGLGTQIVFDPDLVVPDKRKTLREGAVKPWQEAGGRGIFLYYRWLLRSLAKNLGFSLDHRYADLSREQRQALLYGSQEHEFEGVIPNLKRRYLETESEYRREELSRYMRELPCSACQGARLKPESLGVTVNGRSIWDVVRLSVEKARDFFAALDLDERQAIISSQVIKEIRSRLQFLISVGLEYLTLDRVGHTLSGGESERIRLATQVGSGLVGVLYILDEPSIGLHQRDNSKLLKTLQDLRDLGNTVVVIEHDEETIRSADYIVDLGPGAGIYGGKVVAAGSLDEVLAVPESITARYLRGEERIPVPARRRRPDPGRCLEVRGAQEFNLKKIDVRFPLGLLICVTGVSGSGKSTLVNEILYKGLRKRLYDTREAPGRHREIVNANLIDKVIEVDQSPIGRTPRSNPATYTNLFTEIRNLFSRLPEARLRGYTPGRFSFNVKGGRCESCQGEGITKIEMHFLPDIFVPCEVCRGTRYNRETLEILYKGKNIADVLKMQIQEAVEFFRNIPSVRDKLAIMNEVGLGYLELGQPATTLSGGEAQRVKLAAELARKGSERTLYLLDEPTTGLHFADIRKLLHLLNRLVEKGSTVVVIEHNLDVIKTADYLIDLGPEGGERGGELVACGTPAEVARSKKSYTGRYLKPLLARLGEKEWAGRLTSG